MAENAVMAGNESNQRSNLASEPASLLEQLATLDAPELRRLLAHYLTQQKLGLYWEHNDIERDRALNDELVFPRLDPPLCHGDAPWRNLIIEGDNFDALRLLKATYANRVRVIYIDPPYNTGNKDWVYNDRYISDNDRYRHSLWLEFLYRRLTLARDLLTPDGVILVSINDENRAKLELLMDQVFQGMRLGSFVWRNRQGSNADQDCFLSIDHEHVLVYGSSRFRFAGYEKSYEMYANPDHDPRGDWRPSDLTLGFSWLERPNLYYPLRDPATDIYYPPNPDRIWVYASRDRLKPGQRVQAKTMEEFIETRQILFPSEQRVAVWATLDELLASIDRGDVPKTGKTPTLRRELPNLEFWVGKKVGFGRPAFKRYKADLRNLNQPVSSWITPKFEAREHAAENTLISGTNQEGSKVLTTLFGGKPFNYPKPLSLLKALLQQATTGDDLVLDFFAGSGTTAQAVLELNQEDGGARRFILVSAPEATPEDPHKNLCRDVCAERVRRVMHGYRGKPGAGGGFAYIRLQRIAPADVRYELDAERAWNTLYLRLTAAVQPWPNQRLNIISQNGESAWVLCPAVDETTLSELQALPAHKLVVYSDRPTTVSEALADRKTVDSQSWREAASAGQGGK
jgi:adenine-specific DNA-methyltransferase